MSLKAERLEKIKQLKSYLDPFDNDLRLGENIIWEGIEQNECVKKYCKMNKEVKLWYLDISGKSIQSTVRVKYAKDLINGYIEQYGDRVRRANNNGNRDWKSVSHSIRIAYEIRQIYTKGVITFPLENAKHIIDIKNGLGQDNRNDHRWP